MNVYYQLSHYSRYHLLQHKYGLEQSRSFVKAFLQMLYCMMSGLSQSVVDIDNTSRTIAASTRAASLNMLHPGLSSLCDSHDLSEAASTSQFVGILADDCGIVIGTSSTAVAVADDNLVIPIARGSSAGQMIHYGCWSLNYTTGASSASFDVERIFRNDSGGSIVVAEIGIYVVGSTVGNGATVTYSNVFGFCILRDVISPTVTVLNGEYLKVKYTITVSN